MIQSLRQKHRIITMVLAILLPILFILALFVRKPIPANNALPIFKGLKGVAR